MQERLNQVVMEKKKESRSGMEIMNLLQVNLLLVCSVTFKISFDFLSRIYIILTERRQAAWDMDREES